MKKLLSVLLVISSLLLIVASCTGDTGPQASVAPSSAPTASTPSDKVDGPGDDGADEFSWPLAETATFEIWNGPMSSTANMLSPNDSFAYQEAERRTNVQIKWLQPAEGQEKEQFLLIVASDNYPDSFFNGNYVGGYDAFVDNEIIIDLRELLELYAPNWTKMATLSDLTWKMNVTDAGRIPVFNSMSHGIQPTFWGTQVREDFLEDLGIDTPITYDDWFEYLKRAKEEKGAKKGYMMFGENGLDDNMLSGFDLIQTFFVKDKVVKFGPYEDALLDYLTKMKMWYENGLIDPDFMSRNAMAYLGETALILNGDVSAWHSFYSSIDIHTTLAGDSRFQGVAVPLPVHEQGQTRKLSIFSVPDSNVQTGHFASITTQCEDPVTLVRWFDYFYSDEGEILADYGIEGQAHTMVDGRPVYNEIVLNNPDGMSQRDCQHLYAIGQNHPRQYDWSRGSQGRSEYALTAGPIWDANWDQDAGYENLLGVTLTEDESARYTPLINDINTYITESVVAFIVGSKPLSEFEAYRDQLKTIGMETCIEIYQDAFNRFDAR